MEGTKNQLVDFIYASFNFKGGMTKKRLREYPLEKLEKVITKNNSGTLHSVILYKVITKNNYEEKYKEYLKSLKYPKYFVDANIDGKDLCFDGLKAPNKDIIEDILKKDYPDVKISITKIVLNKNNHRCKYCGEIVEGTNKDYLCEECCEVFGHHLYSEL